MNPAMAEQILQYALVASAVIAIATGLFTVSFKSMVFAYSASVFVTLLVLIPDYAFFCRHPRHWLIPTPFSGSKIRED